MQTGILSQFFTGSALIAFCRCLPSILMIKAKQSLASSIAPLTKQGPEQIISLYVTSSGNLSANERSRGTPSVQIIVIHLASFSRWKDGAVLWHKIKTSSGSQATVCIRYGTISKQSPKLHPALPLGTVRSSKSHVVPNNRQQKKKFYISGLFLFLSLQKV